jgi:hypothetical protein
MAAILMASPLQLAIPKPQTGTEQRMVAARHLIFETGLKTYRQIIITATVLPILTKKDFIFI